MIYRLHPRGVKERGVKEKLRVNNQEAKQFLKFIHLVEGMKKITRHAWTSKPRRQESVADHSYRMALMAMVLAPEFGKN